MIGRARIVALAVAASALTACFEVDHAVEILPEGAVHYTWKLALDAKVTAITRAPTDSAWLEETNDALAGLGAATIDHAHDQTVYGLDVTTPDLVAWGAFRDAFIARYAGKYPAAPYLYPPTITAIGGRWRVAVDAEPVSPPDAPRVEPPPERATRWTLTVSAPDVKVHNADSVRPDGTLVWETTIANARFDGVHTEAIVAAPAPLVSRSWGWWIAGGALLLIAAASGYAFRRRG